MLAGRGGAGDGEDSRTDHRANAERDQAPDAEGLLKTLFRLFGCRDQRVDALSAKELVHPNRFWFLVSHRTTRNCRRETRNRLPLPLALGQFLDPFLGGAARYAGCPLWFGGGFLAGCALQFLALCLVGNGLSIHSSYLLFLDSCEFF